MLHQDFNHILEDAINIQIKIDEYVCCSTEEYSYSQYHTHIDGVLYYHFKGRAILPQNYYGPNHTISFNVNNSESYVNATPNSYSIIYRRRETPLAHRFNFGKMYLIFYPDTMTYLCTENDISVQHYFKADKDMREILQLEYNIFKG
jgi:hypothetical protein